MGCPIDDEQLSTGLASLSLSSDVEKTEEEPVAAGAEEELEGKLVEMPPERLAWILGYRAEYAPTPEELGFDPEKFDADGIWREAVACTRALQEDFLKYQASVREELETTGRVMVPEYTLGPYKFYKHQYDDAEDFSDDDDDTPVFAADDDEGQAPPPSN